jgi:hypothetical protein
MTKIELIKYLSDDVEKRGNGEVKIAISGNSTEAMLEVDIAYPYMDGIILLLSDICKFEGGKFGFKDKVEEIDDWRKE